jgi:hypothetical protein
LIVSSPSITSCSPSRRIAVEAKRSSGVALGVEEVRRAEVRLQVLVLDDDRARVDGAEQLTGAVLADCERRVEVLEASAERRDDHVLDGEARRGMGRVELPRAARKLRLGLCCGG